MRGEWSCVDLTETYLSNIDKGAHLNAFVFSMADRARARAAEIDGRIKTGDAGKLAGLTLAVKDNIVIKGERAGCASAILDGYVSPYSATVIEKLEAEDAIIIGRTNMDEFAMGSSNENSCHGPVKNPNDPTSVTGGSSGGSCAAVSAGMALAALGSDTGGSIRQPASFCGVVGLKPTYGRVSRYGLVAFASSFDQIGPITQNVADAALLLEVMCGLDLKDSTSSPESVPDFTNSVGRDIQGLRIGLPSEYFGEGLNNEVRQAIDNTIDILKQRGAAIVEVSLPHTDYAIAAYYVLTTAEASSNLSRYDGARYGFRAADVSDLDEMYINSRNQGFGEEVKRRIMLGTYVLSAGYYDAYYRKAQQVRTLIKRDFAAAFERCDCLLTPTAPTTAFKIGEKIDDPLTMYLSDIYTVSINLAGLPAISVPCGSDENGLPVGAQIVGNYFDEEMLIRLGHQVHCQAGEKSA